MYFMAQSCLHAVISSMAT